MIHRHDDRRAQTPTRRQLYAACLLALTAFGGSGTVLAQSSEAPRVYMIDAGSLEAALNQLARQSQVQIVFRPELVAGKRVPALSGELTWRQALARLLDGSGLDHRQVADKTIVIQASEPSAAPAARPPAPSSPAPPAARAEPRVTDVDTMTVTGTRIRGGSTPSPVISIGAERIREEGFSDLGEVIRAIPQNYSGGQNPGVLAAATGTSNVTNQNGSGGSGLNLRGLGPDATLTLLNGRRMTYSSFAQAIDVGAIPVEAVDRVEVVTDGASAIYGSDAVGGVGNVILKRDFEGVQVGARYGRATDGGLATREYTVTTGATWSSGGVIATYKDASADPIYADQRDYTQAMYDPHTIYPGNDLRSGLVSAYQALGSIVELRLDALRTERKQVQLQAYPAFWYDSPTDTTSKLVSPSLEISLPGDWTLLIGGSWGKDENIQHTDRVVRDTGVSTLVAESCYCNESRVYEVSADGPLFPLGQRDAQLALGFGYRTNEFVNASYLSTSRYGGDESSRFVYGEIIVPLMGSATPHRGTQRLELSAAVRTEDYDSFGRITTPKFGVIYGPSASFTLKASWGKSFKAPTLDQKYQPRYAFLYAASAVGGTGYPADATVLMSWGGSTTPLDAERATTWTASLAFHPEAIPGLEAELTWFDIDYSDRVVQPLTGRSQSLSNPAFAEFIHYAPTAEEQAQLLALYSSAFYNTTGAAYNPSNVVAIGRGEYTNARRQWIKGADVSGSYRFDVGAGRLTLRGSASWLDITQQLVADQTPYDVSGALHYPAKFRARAGGVWAQGGFTGSIFANHVEGVTYYSPAGARNETASFTTLDATLRYLTAEGQGGWSGLELALYAQNLLDRGPPLHMVTVPTNVPYDSSNYSAIGRFVGLSISKRW